MQLSMFLSAANSGAVSLHSANKVAVCLVNSLLIITQQEFRVNYFNSTFQVFLTHFLKKL